MLSQIETAKQADSRAIWEIRYHSLINTEQNVINTAPVNFAAHDDWFRSQYFKDDYDKCFVLRLAGKVIGYCRFDLYPPDINGGYLTSIAIHPDYQGKGYGDLLLAESLKLLGDKNVHAILRKENRGSLHLFKKNGFSVSLTSATNYFLEKKRPIKYGLKLWSSNARSVFAEAKRLCQWECEIDFIELYHDARASLDFDKLEEIKGLEVYIHNPHSHGFHEFELGEQQLKIWQDTLKMADFFNSRYIIVHPGQARDFNHFEVNLKKIDDPRILIENMAGLDIYGKNVYANTIQALRDIKTKKNICFDLEKAVKSAKRQNIDYKDFIFACLQELKPFYFHLSGGNKDSPIDEHKNLWEANFDIGWIRSQLITITELKDGEIFLVFETPKDEPGLVNDIKNINFFRQIDS